MAPPESGTTRETGSEGASEALGISKVSAPLTSTGVHDLPSVVVKIWAR